MKEWLIGLKTRYNRYEIYVDSSEIKPFGILCNNDPLPKRYSTIWGTIRSLEYLTRLQTVLKFYIGTIDSLEDAHPQTHDYFIKHYLTGKYRP